MNRARLQDDQSPRRGPRGLARLVSGLVVAVMAATLLTAGPAAAWTDSGPGSSSGGSGSSGTSGSGSYSFHCGNWLANGLSSSLYVWLGGSYNRYIEQYSNCIGRGSTNKLGTGGLVPTGFLVYRFYGTANNPVAAMTRSRTNLTSWGAEESSYSFPAANPMDAGQSVGAPWSASSGTSWDQANSWIPDQIWRRNDAGQLVPNSPQSIAGSCSSIQTGSAIQDWFNKADPAQQVAFRATLGMDYWQASQGGRYPATGRSEAGIHEIKSGYRFSWNAWKKGDKSQKPVPAANGDAYYLESFTFENRACASPFQFSSSASTPVTQRPVIGTCYIPLMRKYVDVRDNGGYWRQWPTIQSSPSQPGLGDGERMSNFYNGQPYTINGPGGDTLDAGVTGLNGTQQANLIRSWRDAMRGDYLNWAAGGITTASGAQVVPVNPYVSDGNIGRLGERTQLDINAASWHLYSNARCRVGSSITFDTPTPTAYPEVNAAVNLKVDTAEVLQVSPTEVTFKVTPEPLRCNGKGCPANVEQKSLDWVAKLTGTENFKLCKVTGNLTIPADCDGAYTVSESTSNGIKRSTTFKVRFARATSAKQTVQMCLTNMKGTYTQSTSTKGMQIKGISPITGQPYTIDTGPLTSSITKSNKVTASGKPTALKSTSGGLCVNLPVLGAVEVPK